MRIIKVFTAGWLLALAVLSCEKEEEVVFPQAVQLISPSDGETFTDQAPTFTWSSDTLATSYILRIAVDDFSNGAVLIVDTLQNTTYQMSENLLLQLYKGSFQWAVAPLPAEEELLWSEHWTFSIDKSSAEPFLISPDDGAVFDVTSPTFIWYEDVDASAYVIRIVKDAFFSGVVIVEDTLTDTTYTMSAEDFVGSLNSDYMWGVACTYGSEGITWKGIRSFTLDKPSIDIDLDTTYFPFGLDYSWTYENYHYHDEWMYPYPDTSYDTVTIRVVDSTFGENGWIFTLNGSFQDVGDTVSIVGNRIFVYGLEWISIIPKAGEYDAGIEVEYDADTVNVSRHTSGHYLWDDYLDAYWTSHRNSLRIKGVGVVFANYDRFDQFGHTGYIDIYHSSTLLYFCKGTDTIWRREP